jgi:hypothetical protein
MISETSKHMTRRPHKGRVSLFHESMADATSHLERANVNAKLIAIYELYLTGQGLVTMESCTPHLSHFLPLSRAHDFLGWDCFV